jgi:hypothetical protein
MQNQAIAAHSGSLVVQLLKQNYDEAIKQKTKEDAFAEVTAFFL